MQAGRIRNPGEGRRAGFARVKTGHGLPADLECLRFVREDDFKASCALVAHVADRDHDIGGLADHRHARNADILRGDVHDRLHAAAVVDGHVKPVEDQINPVGNRVRTAAGEQESDRMIAVLTHDQGAGVPAGAEGPGRDNDLIGESGDESACAIIADIHGCVDGINRTGG